MSMLTIAYIGNGKSTNRYNAPFAQKVEKTGLVIRLQILTKIAIVH